MFRASFNDRKLIEVFGWCLISCVSSIYIRSNAEFYKKIISWFCSVCRLDLVLFCCAICTRSFHISYSNFCIAVFFSIKDPIVSRRVNPISRLSLAFCILVSISFERPMWHLLENFPYFRFVLKVIWLKDCTRFCQIKKF